MERTPLRPSVAAALEAASQQTLGGRVRLEPFAEPDREVFAQDTTYKWRVLDERGGALAFLVCSAEAGPDIVARDLARVREVRGQLGPGLDRVLLAPLHEGRAEGLSFALMPVCRGLVRDGWRWWIQRARLAPPLLQWLRAVTERTRHEVDEAHLDDFARRPLRQVAEDEEMSPQLRDRAAQALDALAGGAFRPMRVLVHNDLWKGNVLLDPARRTPGDPGLVIIDWAAARPDGHPLYDLLKLARSLRVRGRRLRREVDAHCALLACPAEHARFHLASALGALGLDLEHFPRPIYLASAEEAMRRLDEAL